MKKYTSIICTMAVLLMASAVTFVSCAKDEEPTVSGKFTLTVNASKGAPATKHLEEGEGNTITATWKTGESVTVNKGETYLGRLYVTTEGSSTTLSGEITGTIAENDELTLEFLDPIDEDYEQGGTLADIATHFDHAVATVTVTSISGSSVTTTKAEFENQQAIVKFTLQNMSHEDLYAQKLEVTVNGKTYKVDPDPEGDATANVFYVAIPGFENKEVTLTATVIEEGEEEDTEYEYTKTVSGITFVNGQYYTVTVGMKELLTLNIPDEVGIGVGDHNIYYTDGETWAQAITNHPTQNEGWIAEGRYVYWSGFDPYPVFDDTDYDLGYFVSPSNTIDVSRHYLFSVR